MAKVLHSQIVTTNSKEATLKWISECGKVTVVITDNLVEIIATDFPGNFQQFITLLQLIYEDQENEFGIIFDLSGMSLSIVHINKALRLGKMFSELPPDQRTKASKGIAMIYHSSILSELVNVTTQIHPPVVPIKCCKSMIEARLFVDR